MKFTTVCCAFAVALMTSDCVQGQLLKNLFGGSGGNETTQSTPSGIAGAILGQSNDSATQQPFRLPFLFKQPSSQEGMLGQGGIGDLTNLVPKPELPSFNPPNLINQFNAKSKQMIDRTTDWARERQDRLKEKAFGRLESVNPLGFLAGATDNATTAEDIQAQANRAAQAAIAQPSTKPPASPNYFAPPKTNQAIQPPIRTASSPDGQPAMRF